MTFSIVAYDPHDKAWGVAIASKILAVGAICPYARVGAGAIATQSYSNVSFGPEGLDSMARGYSAQTTLDRLLANDKRASFRQVGMVDAYGGVATHTGADCASWAGSVVGEYFAIQGNILTGEEVIYAMRDAFQSTSGDLATRLFNALQAGDEAGGDSRGRQSAALLVAKLHGGLGRLEDRFVDLRVDDDPAPSKKLFELLMIHRLYYTQTQPQDILEIDTDLAHELQLGMQQAGLLTWIDAQWGEVGIRAFESYLAKENLSACWNVNEPHRIDRKLVDYLRLRFKN